MVRAKGSTAHPRRGWEQLRECPVCTRGRLVVLQAAALTRQVNGVASHICPWPHESVLGLHSPAKVTPGQCVATEPEISLLSVGAKTWTNCYDRNSTGTTSTGNIYDNIRIVLYGSRNANISRANFQAVPPQTGGSGCKKVLPFTLRASRYKLKAP